ncbi:MAG: hypothetical protein QM820_35220 [Minicystis sp.]
MAGKFMKGALIQFMPTILIPLPNVIIFQYNPETIEHSWTQPDTGSSSKGGAQGNPQAVPGMPGESFSFSLVMDANDQLAEGNPIALLSGVHTRLAALEMLLFPADFSDSLLGPSSGDDGKTVPQLILPTALFVWGPARILPVRLTSLSISEKLYDALLNPIHAEAKVSLRVLTSDELAAAKKTDDPLADLASMAYDYSHGLRKGFAIANLANAVESIVGMLPV